MRIRLRLLGTDVIDLSTGEDAADDPAAEEAPASESLVAGYAAAADLGYGRPGFGFDGNDAPLQYDDRSRARRGPQ